MNTARVKTRGVPPVNEECGFARGLAAFISAPHPRAAVQARAGTSDLYPVAGTNLATLLIVPEPVWPAWVPDTRYAPAG